MNSLDPIPIWLLYLLMVGLALGAAELGFRMGRWRQRQVTEGGDAAIGAMVGATLGLLAFLLAFLTSIAADRFDNRRAMVATDANAIGTAQLRSLYLPEPHRGEAQALYREYVEVRVPGPGFDIATTQSRSVAIQGRLWEQVLELADGQSGSELFSLYVDALNQLIEVHTLRNAAVQARIPPALLLMILAVAAMALFLVGYGDSYRPARSWVGLSVTTFIFAAVLILIVDLDRPLDGFLRVSQQPMIELQQRLQDATSLR
jgi:hypothetical protein